MAGTPPLSTEHIIAQLRQLRELLPAPLGETMTDFDGPELAATKRLLDVAKSREFAFERIAPGPDGPLRGVRRPSSFRDEIYLGGFWEPDSCSGTRRRHLRPAAYPLPSSCAGMP